MRFKPHVSQIHPLISRQTSEDPPNRLKPEIFRTQFWKRCRRESGTTEKAVGCRSVEVDAPWLHNPNSNSRGTYFSLEGMRLDVILNK